MSAEQYLYQEIFDLSPIPDAVFDQDGVCRTANRAFLVTFGFREEDLEKRRIRFEQLFLRPDTGQRLLEALLEKTIIRRREVSLQTQDQMKKIVLFSGRVLEGGHFETSFVDITRLKNLQREVKRDHARLASLIEGVSAGLFLVNRGGKITECNHKLADLLGVPQKDLIHKNHKLLFRHILSSAVEPAVVQQAFSRALVKVQERPVVEFSVQDGESRYLEMALFPVWDEEGLSTGWGGMLQDVTDIHDRMDWKMDLLSMMAHDIRTPLAALKGHATALLGSYRSWGSDMVMEFLQAINRSTDQLIQQVERSLALTRVEAGKLGLRPEAVEVEQLLNQTLERMGSALQDQLVEIRVDGALPQVRVDSARIEEVLMNLLDNAVRHAPSSRPIEIEASHQQDMVRISVRDHGPGIQADKAPLIFEQYEQLHPDDKGSGLGLYISRKIVEAHGGSIWLEAPEEGSGACFVFTIPVMPSVEAFETPDRTSPSLEPPAAVQASHILVVEDEADFQTLYYAILGEHGYQVEIAGDGPTAIDVLMGSSPDLVILDWLLPGMDGLSVLRGIRRWTQIPILLVTSRTSQKDLVTALDAGADDYLTKPFQSDELLARIRALLRRGEGWLEVDTRSRYSSGGFSIDFDSQQVWVAGEKVQLTPTEYQILAYLVHNRGQVLTYDQIVSEVWGGDPSKGRQDLFVHVSRLRRKLTAAVGPMVVEKSGAQGSGFIETRWGLGYLFSSG